MTQIKELTEANFNEVIRDKQGVVLVKCWADWCGPCKVLTPIVQTIADENLFEVYQLDTDENPTLVKKLGIRSVPTCIVFKDGKAEKTIVGLMTKDALLKLATACL